MLKGPGIVICLLLLIPTAAMAAENPAEKAPKVSLVVEETVLSRFTQEQRGTLLAGDAIFEYVEVEGEDGEEVGRAQTSILILQPISVCFDIFCRFDKHALYFPRNTESEVVKKSGDSVWVRKVYDFTLTSMEYTIRYTVDADEHRIDFELDPEYPHDLKDTAGYFHFEVIDGGRTLLTYVAEKVEAGVMIPGFLKRYLTSRDLPSVVENIKKRTESASTWTKPD